VEELIQNLISKGANPNQRTNTVPVRGFMQGDASWVNFDGQTPFLRAAMEKDELALGVLRETGRILGGAIASVINLLNVEVVVIGGGVMAAGELILEPIREEVQRSVVQPCVECLRIVAAELGQDAGILGAGLLARDTFAERTAQAGG